MVRCGHTVLSLGYERPEELTLEQYNNFIIEMVEERLARTWEPEPLKREDLTNLFNLIKKQHFQVDPAHIYVPPGYVIPPGAKIIIDGMGYSVDMVTGDIGHVYDVKLYFGKEKPPSEEMFRALVQNSPSTLHSRLLQEYRGGDPSSRSGDEAAGRAGGEEKDLDGRHSLLVSAGVLRS